MKQTDLKNPFGGPVYYEECLSSTMDFIRNLAANGEPHGTAILANFQESGRGRHGRLWKSGKGQSLMCSVFLKFNDFSAIPAALTLKTGLAVSLAIEDFVPALEGFVQVKWPNDVMLFNNLPQKTGILNMPWAITEKEINNPALKGRGMLFLRGICIRGLMPFLTALKGGVLNPSTRIKPAKTPCSVNTFGMSTKAVKKNFGARKVAGILTEADAANVYIGIGVNLSQRSFPEGLQNKAGSLLSFFEEIYPGTEIPCQLLAEDAPLKLLQKILFCLYRELKDQADQLSWKTRLETRLYKRGEQVGFAEGAADSADIIQGRLAGIGEAGELLLVPQGEEKERPFITGELLVYQELAEHSPFS
jgi:biotin-(acetyl-CoA carboxylase) ligase